MVELPLAITNQSPWERKSLGKVPTDTLIITAEQYKEAIMPKKDGKGPKGKGPKTGKGGGNCK